MPRTPTYGPRDPDAVLRAATDEPRALLRDVLGADLEAAVRREADGRDAARCRQQVARSVQGCHATLLRELDACKRRGLARKNAPFDDAADLASCFGADPKGMIAKRCDRRIEKRPGRFILDPLRRALETRCVARGVDLGEILPACAAATVEEAHACLERAARCRACLAVEASDALDDGVANASCASPLGSLACTLDDETGFFFESSAGFLGGGLAGTLEVACGTPDAASGTAPCTCGLAALSPVEVPGRGWACASPVDGCPAGTIDCDGGTSLDLAISADHDVGTCTGNASCAAQCATSCAASGADVWDSGCEGFCEGGASDGGACAGDAQCPGGRCNGVAGGGHGNVCQCQRIELTSGGSGPGGLRCNLGLRLRVEAALPCDGADVLLDLGDRCLPLTTESAQASLVDQDHVPGRQLPNGSDVIAGQALGCDALHAGSASGLVLVSAANAFDVPLAGDVYVLFALGCE